ncbi:hypothetical protein ACFE04_014627 [Oxalis oulophora]
MKRRPCPRGGDLGSDFLSIQSSNGENPGRAVEVSRFRADISILAEFSAAIKFLRQFVPTQSSKHQSTKPWQNLSAKSYPGSHVSLFGLCFNSIFLGATRVGQLDVSCLGFVDVRLDPVTSIVITDQRV